jgi:hypothetical protein
MIRDKWASVWVGGELGETKEIVVKIPEAEAKRSNTGRGR